jgi:hypothetical protein
MHVHVTCSTPRRSLVIAVQAVRELLRGAGHRVSVSWPETIATDEGELRLGLSAAGLAEAAVLVHVAAADDEPLPPEVEALARLRRPVVRWVPSCRSDEPALAGATCAVSRAEAVADAICRAAAATVG